MKKVIMSVCALAIAFVALPVFAAVQTEGKNDCLVYGKNCPNAVDSLPERIAKLKTEIGVNRQVYLPVPSPSLFSSLAINGFLLGRN